MCRSLFSCTACLLVHVSRLQGGHKIQLPFRKVVDLYGIWRMDARDVDIEIRTAARHGPRVHQIRQQTAVVIRTALSLLFIRSLRTENLKSRSQSSVERFITICTAKLSIQAWINGHNMGGYVQPTLYKLDKRETSVWKSKFGKFVDQNLK